MIRFLDNLWELWCEAAPWLLFGLLVSGLLKAWFPSSLMQRWLGAPGWRSITKAAFIGTPIPLCSCSVLPAALQLRRGGASRGSTVSFLIATPENGADSLAISYALLGPFMTIMRPIAAVFSALIAGLSTEWISSEESDEPYTNEIESCCKSETHGHNHGHNHGHEDDGQSQVMTSTLGGVRYAMTRLLSDITLWLVVGILLAAVIRTAFPETQMSSWGSGLLPMVGVLLLGIPMYICATASTPIGAAMLLAGVSPGTVLVFLLAGPATNIAGIAVVKKELGRSAVIGYLIGICVTSLSFGLLTDWIVATWSIDVIAQAGTAHMLPHWLGIACGVLLIVLMVRSKLIENWPQQEPKSASSEPQQLVQISLEPPQPVSRP